MDKIGFSTDYITDIAGAVYVTTLIVYAQDKFVLLLCTKRVYFELKVLDELIGFGYGFLLKNSLPSA